MGDPLTFTIGNSVSIELTAKVQTVVDKISLTFRLDKHELILLFAILPTYFLDKQ